MQQDEIEQLTTNLLCIPTPHTTTCRYDSHTSGICPFKNCGSLIGAALVCLILNTSAQAFPTPDQIFVANFGGDNIEKFDVSGTDLGSFVTISHPTGVAFDNAGNLFVGSDEPGSVSIHKISPSGVDTIFASDLSDGPQSLAFDRSGNLYVAEDNIVEKYTPDGNGTVFADEGDGLNTAIGLAFDSSDNLYVSNQVGGISDNGTIEKFTPDGTGSLFANTGLNHPYGLALDSAGHLYVANLSNNTIERFTPDGTPTLFASTGLDQPVGLVFDSAGNLYATNRDNTIEKFSPTGTDLGVFASTGLNIPYFLTIFRPTHLHFEIERLRVTASSAGYRIVRDVNASGGKYGLLQSTAVGQFVAYRLPLLAPGTYDVKIGIQRRNDKGIFQLAIGGVNQGNSQDEYSATTSFDVRDLGTVTLTTGNKAFKFFVVGRNPSSRGYTLAFDYIDLDLVP